jgi:hypothetical protein
MFIRVVVYDRLHSVLAALCNPQYLQLDQQVVAALQPQTNLDRLLLLPAAASTLLLLCLPPQLPCAFPMPHP